MRRRRAGETRSSPTSSSTERQGNSTATPNLSEIATSTIDARSGVVADNVTAANPLYTYIKKRGNLKTVDGGDNINEEISFAENGNAGWYSGMDPLPVNGAEVITSAQFQWKQLAAAVVISGLDRMKNKGEAKILDLLDARMEVAENTLANFLERGAWGDGTSYGGKSVTGVDLAIPIDPTTGTYGGINRANWTMWRSQIQDDAGAPSATTIQPRMNALYAKCVRGSDVPDLILLSQTYWSTFVNSMQLIQRVTDVSKADLGFKSLAFMGSDVVLAGGIGMTGNGPTDTNGTGYFINTKYFKLRPHVDRQFTSLDPEKRYAVNQDAMVVLIGWMGNLTSRGAQFSGRLIHH